MKKLLSILLFFPFCLNAQTVKKVMVETSSALWCGYCPASVYVKDTALARFPANVYTATFFRQGMTIKGTDSFANMLGLSSTFSAFVDRRSVAPHQVGNEVQKRLATPAIASVSFSKLKDLGNGSFEADINVMFNTAPENGVPLMLQVYMTSDSVKAVGGTQQQNYTAWLENGANPLQNWWHTNVAAIFIGSSTGFKDVFPAKPQVGKTYTKKIVFPNMGLRTSLYAIVAYSAGTKEIINTERMNIKALLDVDDQKQQLELPGIYPNPAKASDILNIPYNIAVPTMVTLDVYNIAGQKVATPYRSQEITGQHTIRWRPADYGLAPGTYMLHLSGANEKVAYRLSVY